MGIEIIEGAYLAGFEPSNENLTAEQLMRRHRNIYFQV